MRIAAPFNSVVRDIGNHSEIFRGLTEIKRATKNKTENIQVAWIGLLIDMIINYVRPELIAGHGRMK